MYIIFVYRSLNMPINQDKEPIKQNNKHTDSKSIFYTTAVPLQCLYSNKVRFQP